MRNRFHAAFIEPMKASTAGMPPDNGEWLYEVKFDGFRTLAVKNGSQVELWSRNEKLLNERFPTIVASVKKLSAKQFILDGEVCALDNQGRSSFQLLQNSANSGSNIVYYPFDLLHEGPTNLCRLPLIGRKQQLSEILKNPGSSIYPSPFFTKDRDEILAKMRAAGAEGAVAKLINSIYEPGHRTPNWIKIKFHKGQEFVIAGYTAPKNSRQCFGALLLGYYNNKRLIFAGRVGTGFTEKTLRTVYEKLQPLRCQHPRIEQVQEPSERWRQRGWKAPDVFWVQPRLVAQVQFTEWTSDGILRHPSFQGLRDDKKPEEVVREMT